VNAVPLRSCVLIGVGVMAGASCAAVAEASRLPAPERDYVLHCRGCHGADGSGVAHRIPSLRGSLGRYMRSEEGRDFVMRVPGAANSALSDTALAAVLNWMAMRFAGEELAGEVRWFTATEVAPARRRPLLAVRAERSAVVRRLAAAGIDIPDEY
jgi:cytochrome c553